MVASELVLPIYNIYEIINENQSPCHGLKMYLKMSAENKI